MMNKVSVRMRVKRWFSSQSVSSEEFDLIWPGHVIKYGYQGSVILVLG